MTQVGGFGSISVVKQIHLVNVHTVRPLIICKEVALHNKSNVKYAREAVKCIYQVSDF